MKSIFVGNLPFSATETEIGDLFAQHGTVHSVRIITDRETGRPRGFAFVKMDDGDVAAAVQALDGSVFGGRNLRVNEAEDRPPADRTKSPRPAYGGAPSGGGAPKPAYGGGPAGGGGGGAPAGKERDRSFPKSDRATFKKRDAGRENRRFNQEEDWD